MHDKQKNLDNTAGAGLGINEAFNDTVHQALFRLTDSGVVEPVLAAPIHPDTQRQLPSLPRLTR